MRISCNGCRVLRKGCSNDCSIRPCLRWIRTPQSQANATLFLAKFYGRTGLINLLSTGPHHVRPAIFKSLLYEACGRIINPIYGSAGLLQSGSWHLCQAAVEAVLSGAPVSRLSLDSAAGCASLPLISCDIRHVSKRKPPSSSDQPLDGRRRRKRGASKRQLEPAPEESSARDESANHDSRLTHRSNADVSVESVEERADDDGESELDLELSLVLEPRAKRTGVAR